MVRTSSVLLLLMVAGIAHAGAPAKTIPVWPGVTKDGSVLLPNTWSIKPAGKQLEIGDFPINLLIEGNLAVVLHAGYGPHEIMVVDTTPKKERVKSRVIVEQSFGGLAFSPNRKHLFVGGGEFDVVHQFAFDGSYLSNHREIKVAGAKFIPGNLTVSPKGETLYVPGVFGHAVAVVDLTEPPSVREPITLGKDSYPFTCLVDSKGQRLFVSLWNKSAVAVIDLKTKKLMQTLSTEKHPTEMIFGPGEQTLFVACTNSTRVSVIDLATGKGLETINCALYPGAPNGNTPSSISLTPDGQILFVANADNNNLAVFNVAKPGESKPLGFIPVGMYPTSVRYNPTDKRIYVTNGRGATVKANPQGPNPLLPKNPTVREYIAGLYRGTLNIIDMPNEAQMVKYSKQAYECSPLRADLSSSTARPEGNPIPDTRETFLFVNPSAEKIRHAREAATVFFKGFAKNRPYFLISESKELQAQLTQYAKLRGITDGKITLEHFLDFQGSFNGEQVKESPIKYCIYVIRENRTYDQVFGDMKEGNGDASLCIFPEKITPNAHRLARQFVLLDNFYCDGEVSAEGHEWSMGAYCTDFVKRVWPLSYRGSPTKKLSIYPAEGNFDDIARPAGGYIWDRCAEAKVTYRSYGEWIENGKTLKDPGKARVKALEDHFDPWFRGYDLDYPDVKRTERFLEEMKRFEKEGKMPQLQIVRLPNDHTYGTRAGKPTPTAMVAENDLALGQLIEGISKSKFWKETAVFVVEDDAQNGSDHVDAHRTVALVISPYTQHGKVDSTMYSTASMLRTMELILGLKPMSQFDAAARPMYNSFQSKPNLTGYKHVVPDTDMKAVNTATAWGAKLAETWDFTKEDAIDDLIFNEVIWRSVRGADSPMPPPVRAAFVFPHLR